MISARKHLIIGLTIRLLLTFLLPPLLDDGLFLRGVRYTDVDYDVFTDAAAHIANDDNGSPYDRHTYRYTPFLAALLALPFGYCDSNSGDDCGAMLKTVTSYKYFGKILFCIADALCGYMIVSMRRRDRRLTDSNSADRSSGIRRLIMDDDFIDALWWLYNPLPINICTRGSAESLVVLLPVLATLAVVQNGNSIVTSSSSTDITTATTLTETTGKRWSIVARSCVAGVFHGIGIHAKLYPLIYTVSFMAYLSHEEQSLLRRQKDNKKYDSSSSTSAGSGTWSHLLSEQMQYVENCMCCFNNGSSSLSKKLNKGNNAAFPWRHPVKIFVLGILWVERLFLTMSSVLFLVFTLITTMGLTYAAVHLYGHEALQEGLLYHFQRMDHRHNYSMYWYWIYLSRGRVAASAEAAAKSASTSLLWMNHIPTIPQICILGFTSLGIAPYDLSMALFLQTFVFVSFNKVMTAQYFTWYLCLLPMCSDRIEWKSKRMVYSLVLLGVAVVGWLVSAFTLEMLGWNTYRYVWMASIFFFVANVNLLVAILDGYRVKTKITESGGCYLEPGQGWSKLKVS